MNIFWIIHHINYLLLVKLFNAFIAFPLFCVKVDYNQRDKDMLTEWLGLRLFSHIMRKAHSLPLCLFICIWEWKMINPMLNGQLPSRNLALYVKAWMAFLFKEIQQQLSGKVPETMSARHEQVTRTLEDSWVSKDVLRCGPWGHYLKHLRTSYFIRPSSGICSLGKGFLTLQICLRHVCPY